MSERGSSSFTNPARLPRVALVGRPNVGKSSLFNRLLGRREAIVLDKPGVTRDRLERPCRLAERVVLLEDTGGIVPLAEEELLREVTRQALSAVNAADVVVLIIDGRAGVTPLDLKVVDALRSSGRPVLVAVNKIDGLSLEALVHDAWRLGMGEPWPISAEQGLGVEELVGAIEALLPPPRAGEQEFDESSGRPDPEVELHVAIVGRPNVGKSSLVNRLVGAERVAVSSRPGTTRDCVDVLIKREGARFRLVDTAGLRRRTRAESQDEAVGILLTRRRIARSHAVILVIDAVLGLTTQDVSIAGDIVEAGRPMVMAVNKWDLVAEPERRMRELDEQWDRRLGFVEGAPRITVSAVTGARVFKLLDECRSLVAAASRRVPTSEANRLLAAAVGEQFGGGVGAPKGLYITQTGVLPPRFVIFCRDSRRATPAFRRFLERRIRERFAFGPTPIILDIRSSR